MKTFLSYLVCVLIAVGAFFAVRAAVRSCDKGPSITWKAVLMDGHRAGAQSLTLDNVDTALGVFGDDGYTSPAGVHYEDGNVVPEVAKVILEVQPKMTELKQVVGHSAAMYTDGRDNPDLPLANFTVDAITDYASKYFKVKMDFGLLNLGGIRVPMPEGAVTLDDLSSMFPFVNYIAYAKVKGAGLTKLLEQLAAQPAFQAVSGVKCVVKNHKLESALIGGKPIDPKKVYNVATIDFLLDGGDGLTIAKNAKELITADKTVIDVMLPYVRSLGASGTPLEYKTDGRVVVNKEEEAQ